MAAAIFAKTIDFFRSKVPPRGGEMEINMSFVTISDVNVWYGKNHALKNVNLEIPANSIYAFIGPSGCGKTTLLRSINRLNDFVDGFRLEGKIQINGFDAYSRNDSQFKQELRRNIGMVFQHSNPLPMSVMQNMLLPVKEHYRMSKQRMEELAVNKLREAYIYDELADRLDRSAMKLSGGQQQRLCIARALMLEPKLLLLDEPCSALDPVSTYKIEQMLLALKEQYTIIIVTHNMEQASRISDYTAFFYEGRIVETDNTLKLFTLPKEELTQNYITGRL
jgi:phosphate transport system ATP-binding protein